MTIETRNMLNRLGTAAVVVCLLAALSACDSTSDPTSVDNAAPKLAALSIDPTSASFDQLPPDQISGDTLARVPISVSVRAEDPDGCVSRVGFVFSDALDPGGLQITDEIAAESTIVPPDGEADACTNGVFEETITVELPRGAISTYTVRVFAVDESGKLGDQMQTQFMYTLESGEPPVLESVTASADTVRRPDTLPAETLTFVAVVSDPDGLANIPDDGKATTGRVIVHAPNGKEYAMNDSGQQGDETADDGRFAASFDIPPETPLGPGTFSFWVIDKNGLSSDTLQKTIVVAE